MDPLTHALASYTLKRAAFPRVARRVTIAMLIAGTVADVDLLSAYIGPSAFLSFYRTYCHSLLGALLFSVLVTLPFLLRISASTEKQTIPFGIFSAALAASLLHLLLDLCQSAGVELFWPVSKRRFALDWVAHVDLWMLGILLAGILLPMLSGLVTEEIGAKSKGPRGRLGASLALATMILYIGLRFVLHGNALAALESRTYRGESIRLTFPLARDCGNRKRLARRGNRGRRGRLFRSRLRHSFLQAGILGGTRRRARYLGCAALPARRALSKSNRGEDAARFSYCTAGVSLRTRRHGRAASACSD